MKELDELREWVTYKSTLSSHNEQYTLAKLDAIEQAIADRYMELPLDADGVPIHCGERMRLDCGHAGEVWLLGAHDIMFSDHTCFDWAKSRHAKPETIEDVLADFAEEWADTTDAQALLERYAERIREVMRDA